MAIRRKQAPTATAATAHRQWLQPLAAGVCGGLALIGAAMWPDGAGKAGTSDKGVIDQLPREARVDNRADVQKLYGLKGPVVERISVEDGRILFTEDKAPKSRAAPR